VAAYFTFNLASSWVWADQTSTQAGVATAGAYTAAGIAGGAASGFVAGGILTGSLKGALKGAATGAIFGGISGAYGSTWNAQRVAANSLAGGVSSEINGGSFKDGFKISMVLSLLTYSATKMRQAMVAQSRLDKRNAAGQSVGSKGDNFKLGGGRFNPSVQVQKPSPFGGIQGQGGRFFGFRYHQGSFIDRLVEAYAGPHDYLNSEYWYDPLTGNIKNGLIGPRAFVGEIINFANIVPATPFTAASVVPAYTYPLVNLGLSEL